MNHQQVEEWIFNKNSRVMEDARMMEEHIKECEACRKVSNGWMRAEQTLSAVSHISPIPGFTNRWLQRLEYDRLNAQLKTSFLLFLAFLGGAFLVILPVAREFGPSANSPIVGLWSILYEVTAWFEFLSGVYSLMRTIVSTFTSLISPATLAFLVFVLILINAGWFLAIRRISWQREFSR